MFDSLLCSPELRECQNRIYRYTDYKREKSIEEYERAEKREKEKTT